MNPNLGQVKFLLVDDRDENLLALESLLVHEKVEMHKARSGKEALGLMLDNDYGLALVDVQMPEMNGFELAELMRGAERTKHIPIVFVTAGNRSPENVFKGYESGAVDFLYKPLDPFVVKSKVRVFMELDQQRRLLNLRIKEVEEAFTALQRTETELHRAIRVRDDFLSIASHELKTPLTPLKLHIQSLIRMVKAHDATATIPSEKVMTVAEKSDVAVKRIHALVENLLDVTRISSGQLTLDCEHVDLSKLVSDVVDRYSESLRAAGCVVETRVEPQVIAWADRIRLEQILSNLLSNAMKYAPACPVRISLTRFQDQARLEVEDRGPGIPHSAQSRIFSRFERASDGTHVSGLGLGLFITRQIAQAHGGQITLESKEGSGTRFIVDIPLAATAAIVSPEARDRQPNRDRA